MRTFWRQKVTELAKDMGVNIIVHRLGKPGNRNEPVIVRLCHRKKRNEILKREERTKEEQEDIHQRRFGNVKSYFVENGEETRSGEECNN